MKAIHYISPESDPQNMVLKMFDRIMSCVNPQIFRRIEDLLSHSTKPIKDTEELSRLLCREPSFPELRIYLVLPDQKKETLDLAYKLFPRHVCSVNDQYDEFISIIKKLYKKPIIFRRRDDDKKHNGQDS